MKPSVATSIWEELEREGRRQEQPTERLFRALGASAVGIRAGYLPGKDVLELLIEVPASWTGDSVIPNWQGMRHEILDLALPPRQEALHLRLFLIKQEHRDIFLMVCEDLVSSLEGITQASLRVKEIEICLLRWRRFFERSGTDGLSIEMQQGLFAELTWLSGLLEAGIDPDKAVSSWKGCERGFHDFDFYGHVVEVKSTKTKEPLSVLISNERQLDDNGLLSLHLYVLSLHFADGGGLTLPDRVAGLQSALDESPAASDLYRKKLISAGYLYRHADLYQQHMVIKSENLYQVIKGFPRIIAIPNGIGDLRYRVFLGACEAFRAKINDYLFKLKEL